MRIEAGDLSLSGKRAERIATPEVLEILQRGHDAASGVRTRSNKYEMYDPDLTVKEFAQHARAIQRLLTYIANEKATTRRLEKLQEEICSLPVAWRCGIDTYGPPHPEVAHPYGYVELAIKNLSRMTNKEQPIIAEHLLQYVNPFCADLSRPGRGGGNRRATRLTDEIQTLARHFERALPEYALSSKEKSLFHRYVHLWMQRAMKAGECPAEKDATRHIKNALNDREKWLTVVKN